ncbi:MAG TPA: hypothetical protein VFU21_29995 [Kofleriaceae bacterium]|nr:hypothetical protein [Kofleriaceae bacterium]
MKWVLAVLVALAVLLVSRAALCEDEGVLAPYGFGLAVGAGVTGFVEADMREVTDPGGTWEVRVTAGTRLPIAFEAAYVGSAQAIDVLGLDPDAVLVGNGVEGGARLDVLPGELNPYFVAGLGWTRYELANADTNTSSVRRRDDILVLPFGVGLDMHVDWFVLDARAVMRLAFGNELMPDSAEPGNPTGLDSVSFLVRGGFEL